MISKSYLVYESLCRGFGLIQLGFGLLVKVGVLVLLGELKILGRNEEICLKMRESRLRWFGYVQRRVINAPVKKSELIQVKRTKKIEEDEK